MRNGPGLHSGLVAWFILCCALCLGGCNCNQDVGTAGKLVTDAPEQRLVFASAVSTEPITRQLLLFNDGAGPVILDGIALTNNADKRFVVEGQPVFPLTLAPGKEAGLSLKVQLTPTSPKGQVSQLVFLSSNAANRDDQGRVTVTLEHQVQVPSLQMDCVDGLDFGDVKAGQSRSRLCKLTNKGSGVLTIKGIQYKPDEAGVVEFRVQEPALPILLKPEDPAGVTLTLVYEPKDFMRLEDAGRFILETDQLLVPGQKAPEIAVKGQTRAALMMIQAQTTYCFSDELCKGLRDDMTCGEASLFFEPVCLLPSNPTLVTMGYVNSSTVGEFHVYSVGNEPLVITAATAVDTHNTKLNLTFFSGTTFPLPARFPPGSDSALIISGEQAQPKPVDGELMLESNAVNMPVAKLQLVGDPLPCRMYLDSLSWVHGKVALGSHFLGPNPPDLTLYNLGQTDCDIKKITIVPTQPADASTFSLTLSRPLPLPIGGIDYKYPFAIKFTPQDPTKLYEAEILVETTDPDRPLIKVPLIVASKEYQPCLTIASSYLIHPKQEDGSCSLPEIDVVIKHSGTAGCPESSITKVEWTKGSSPDFALGGEVALPLKVQSGKEVRIPIAYKGKSTTSIRSQLKILTDSPTQPRFDFFASTTFENKKTTKESFVQDKDLPGPFPKGYKRRFVLEGQTTAAFVLEVLVNDKEIKQDAANGWTYDVKEHAILFAEAAIPPAGATVSVLYGKLCTPS